MEVAYRAPVPADVEAMATLAAAAQTDPEYHMPYLSFDAEAIATDIGDLDGWTETTVIAEADGQLVGWLTADVDHEMGRLWWWGPFVNGDWNAVGDRLHDEVSKLLADNVTEQEACCDGTSDTVRGWCTRHGLKLETASVVLRREPGDSLADGRVRPLTDADHPAIMSLHDVAFPGTHTTPAALVAAEDPRLVIEVDGQVRGYVAYEVQSDGSGYIDYLAVDESIRGQGLGGALVETSCSDMFGSGVSYAHLTVREDNRAARTLYARLGFVEERLATPYRLGFELG